MRISALGFLGVAATGLLVFGAPSAAADPPPLPPSPGYIPGSPLPGPGSYQYTYNIIYANPPYTTDSRGVRIGTNADPSSSSTGLPGSRLGNGQNKTNILTDSNTRYGVQGGITPPTAPSAGMQIGAGNEGPLLEDPRGQPPGSAAGAEASQPTVLPMQPGTPAPILESPDGEPPKAAAPAG